MKRLALLPAILAALPAAAHDAGPVVHAHPHGIESAVAIALGAVIAGWVVLRRRGQ